MVFIMIKKGPEKESASKLSDIEETLKRVLAQAENLPRATTATTAEFSAEVAPGEAGEGAVVGEASPGVQQASPEEIVKLQAVVSEQKQKIVQLEEQSKSSPAAAQALDDGKVKELNSKIDTLESQLKEYEIIEDDIADLSLFKEENISLKKELEALKDGAPEPEPAAAPEPAAEPEPVAAPEPAAEPEPVAAPEPAAESKPVAAPEPAAESVEPVAEAEPTAAPEPAAESEPKVSSFKETKVDTAEEYITDDILAEFSAAVDKEFGHATGKDERAEKNKNQEKVSEVEASDPQSAVDQAMQVATAVADVRAEKENEPKVEEEAEAAINTDKMLEEMAELNKVEADESGGGLEDSADLEKMAAEATDLTNE